MDKQSNVTSAEDLRRMLHKCKKCWQITANGHAIKAYDELQHIRLKDKRRNHCIIVNTLDSYNNKDYVGHWFNVLVYNKQIAVVCDGLNTVKQMPEVWSAVKLFCLNNQLEIHYFSTRYQLKRSDICGYLACFFASKCHNSTLSSLRSLKKLFNRNSIKTNEKYIVNRLKHHLSL